LASRPASTAAAALIDGGVPFAVDIGSANGVHYFNEASIACRRGSRACKRDVKRRLGMLAIPITTLRALRWARPMHLENRIEDGAKRRVRAGAAHVANSYRFGGWSEPEGVWRRPNLWLYSIDSQGSGTPCVCLVARRAHRVRAYARSCGGPRAALRRALGAPVHHHRVDADSEEITRLPAEFGMSIVA